MCALGAFAAVLGAGCSSRTHSQPVMVGVCVPLREQKQVLLLCRGDTEGRWVAARRCFEGHLTPLSVHVPFHCPAWLVALGGGALVPAVCARLMRFLWTVIWTTHVCRWVGGTGALHECHELMCSRRKSGHR